MPGISVSRGPWRPPGPRPLPCPVEPHEFVGTGGDDDDVLAFRGHVMGLDDPVEPVPVAQALVVVDLQLCVAASTAAQPKQVAVVPEQRAAAELLVEMDEPVVDHGVEAARRRIRGAGDAR